MRSSESDEPGPAPSAGLATTGPAADDETADARAMYAATDGLSVDSGPGGLWVDESVARPLRPPAAPGPLRRLPRAGQRTRPGPGAAHRPAHTRRRAPLRARRPAPVALAPGQRFPDRVSPFRCAPITARRMVSAARVVSIGVRLTAVASPPGM